MDDIRIIRIVSDKSPLGRCSLGRRTDKSGRQRREQKGQSDSPKLRKKQEEAKANGNVIECVFFELVNEFMYVYYTY